MLFNQQIIIDINFSSSNYSMTEAFNKNQKHKIPQSLWQVSKVIWVITKSKREEHFSTLTCHCFN